MRTILKTITTGIVAVSLGLGLGSCSALFGSLGYGGYGYDEYGYDGYGRGYDPYGYGNYGGYYGYDYPGYYPDGTVVRPRPRVITRRRTARRPVVVNRTTNVIYTYDNRTGRVIATRVEDPNAGRPVYNGNGRSSSRTVTRTTMPDMSNPRATVSRNGSYTGTRSTGTVTRSAENSVRRSTPVSTGTRVNPRWGTPTESSSRSQTVKTTTPVVTRSSTPAKTAESTAKNRGGNSRSRR